MMWIKTWATVVNSVSVSVSSRCIMHFAIGIDSGNRNYEFQLIRQPHDLLALTTFGALTPKVELYVKGVKLV
jgi:hypothetical protein